MQKHELNVSLESLSAYFNDQIYVIPLCEGFNQFHIVQLEMLNVLVAIRVWANQLNGKTIVIACDNQAIVVGYKHRENQRHDFVSYCP